MYVYYSQALMPIGCTAAFGLAVEPIQFPIKQLSHLGQDRYGHP